MADDPRDVYMFTVTTQVSFTFPDPDEVRRAALAVLDSETFAFMSESERQLERQRVEASLLGALGVLATAADAIASIPGAEPRSSRVTVEPGRVEPD